MYAVSAPPWPPAHSAEIENAKEIPTRGNHVGNIFHRFSSDYLLPSQRLPAIFVALPLQWLGSGQSPAASCRPPCNIADRRGEDSTVAKEDRGFASMDRAKQREIASKGGKAAHQKGTAHEWTSEEARDAGRKGGLASHKRRREQLLASGDAAPSEIHEERTTVTEDRSSSDDDRPVE